MLEEYQKKVLKAYFDKKNSGQLSANLREPTPARLRDECLLVYKERYAPKDDAVLRLFFGVVERKEDYYRRINNYDTSGFKPLVNFLKNKTNKTEHKNIELLAWLIFKPGEETSAVEIEDTPETGGDNKRGTGLWGKKSKWWLGPLVGVPLLVGGYSTFFDKQCMYWTGTAYKAVLCKEENTDGHRIIALNKQRLSHFKKITMPDTLTYYSIGKVWYTKINNIPEFYTAPGTHPVDVQKKLKPLTKYIVDAHLKPKEKNE